MKADVVLIADYGRSGQGWLSYMLCYILNASYIEPYLVLGGEAFSNDERVRNLVNGRLPGREQTRYSLVIKTHNYPSPKHDLTDKIVLLVRDPRDVSVGMFYLNQRRIREGNPASLKIRIAQNIQRSRILNLLFVCRMWAKYFHAWKAIPHHLVRYEDLSRDPAGVLRGILDYLEVDAPQSLIEESVSQFTFERMSGRQKGAEDNANFDFRKGIVGDHKNAYSPFQLHLCSRLFRDRILPAGYDLDR